MIEHLNALAAHFRAELPELAMVGVHSGRFTASELQDSQRVAPPALFVSFTRGAEFQLLPSGQIDAACDWSAFVVTAGAEAAARDAAAITLLRQAVLALPKLRGDRIDAARRITARTASTREMEGLSARDVDALGLTILALQWRQVVRIGDSAFAGWHGDPDYAVAAFMETEGVSGERALDPSLTDPPARLRAGVFPWRAGDIPLDAVTVGTGSGGAGDGA